MSPFADPLSESLQSNVDLDETEMRSVFETAMTNTFGLSANNACAENEPVKHADEIQPVYKEFQSKDREPERRKWEKVDTR